MLKAAEGRGQKREESSRNLADTKEDVGHVA